METSPKVLSTDVFSADPERQATINWIRTNIIEEANFKFIKAEESSSLRKKIAESGGLKFIYATFQNQYSCPDVLVKIPPANDRCLRLCQEHYCAIPDGPDLNSLDIVFIPQHWRRSLPLGNGEQVYRNFYTTEENFLGKTVVADVTIQIKTELSTGKQNIVLNYENIRPKESCRAARIMKIGVANGQIPIFRTDKFISAKLINKSARVS